MATIQTILDKYRPKIDNLDLELLIAHEIKKSREFVLAHPEEKIGRKREIEINKLLARRFKNEPIAHILGHKEFYGIDFKVTKDTLIPRPETELLVERTLQEILVAKNTPLSVIDIGTGSGNIIISIAKNSKDKKINYFGIDISGKALIIAKYNAKKHSLTKIKFIKSNLFEHFLKNNATIKQFNNLIIVANLPYLSKKIYSATAPNVKNFEPKSALYSPKAGLDHYEKLLKQIGNLKNDSHILHVSCFMEIGPEQKKSLNILVKKILPAASIQFEKDLAGKWRICTIKLV